MGGRAKVGTFVASRPGHAEGPRLAMHYRTVRWEPESEQTLGTHESEPLEDTNWKADST